jgi:dienelactone hydrolase
MKPILSPFHPHFPFQTGRNGRATTHLPGARAGATGATALLTALLVLLAASATGAGTPKLKRDLLTPRKQWKNASPRELTLYLDGDERIFLYRFLGDPALLGRDVPVGVVVVPDIFAQPGDMIGECLALSRAGFTALLLPWPRDEQDRPRPTEMANNLERTLRALRRMSFVDPRRLVVLGYGCGGSLALEAAARVRRTRCVVAYYPITDHAAWLAQAPQDNPLRELLANGDWPEHLSPLSRAARIRAAVLLQHGAADDWVPISQSEQLVDAQAQRKGKFVNLQVLQRVPGAGHYFNFLDRDAARNAWEQTIQFIKRAIGKRRKGKTATSPTR